ncbi:NAD(P)H-quinone oxidoreductase [Casimicrobium huifangae]|uniref:NAD(P)H-quinone oxidoreductase n=1 Tax=Casimicrobium huifangae TaxID=2591109 RepID=UPI003784DB24
MTAPTAAPALPATMHYVDHGSGGAPACMQIAQGPLPLPADDEVLIRVAAAGINRPDVLQRSGKYPPPADASPVMGLEVAGEIVAVGAAVTGWHVGDTVCALTPGGGYAEYCKTPAAHCLPIPHGLSVVEAAALPETFFTVWANVFDRARLQAGETILIHGGSSGIGSTAIQLARAFGAGKVIVTCGDQSKIDYALALGAHVGINYKAQDFVAETRAATDGHGADVVLDMVGAPYFQQNLAACATDGRIAQIAFQHGAKAELNMQELMLRRLTWTGSTLRARPKQAKAAIAAALARDVWPRFTANPDALRPHIHAKFALSAVVQAHQMMESGTHLGKIVLVMQA